MKIVSLTSVLNRNQHIEHFGVDEHGNLWRWDYEAGWWKQHIKATEEPALSATVIFPDNRFPGWNNDTH